ncbi:MAG: hypothetical protein BWK75_00200 [Candidatus Altiarchaeales archaeon A3]|nr:MAG: hypothetical protein BWK75_00200 [Candidatus Altiarchaeales archaeon A3]
MPSKILFRLKKKQENGMAELREETKEVVVSDEEISAKESVLTLAAKNDIAISNFCNGRGTCGRCKIIINLDEQEKLDLNKEVLSKVLKQEQILKGYILACLAFPKNNTNIEVIVPSESVESKYEVLSGKTVKITDREISGDAGVAIDIGTTTVATYLADLSAQCVVASEGSYNGQVRFGADVMTRMNYIIENKDGDAALQNAIVSTINIHLKNLSERKKFQKISKIVVSGNTVMTYLFLKKNPLEIRDGAYDNPNFKKAYTVKGRDVRLKYGAEDADVYCVPGLGNYVGGDITSDIIISEIFKEDKICLVIDVGTNGEVALGNNEWMAVCATSAGPAFEGGEVKCGMRAMKGAIDRIKIENHGRDVIYRVIGNNLTSFGDVLNKSEDNIPGGICGSGLIILIAELMRNGLIDASGKFNRKFIKETERLRKSKYYEEQGQEIYEYVVVHRDETESKEDITINEKDLENLKYTKAAIFSGVMTLLRNTGVKFDEIDKIFIAGGFGNFIDLESAILVGLFPDVEREKYKFIGNGSLDGAYRQLTDENERKTAENIASNVTYVDLATDGNFVDEYTAALYFPHSRMDLFPTWKNFEHKRGINEMEILDNEEIKEKEKGEIKEEKETKIAAISREKERMTKILNESKMFRIEGFKIEGDELEIEM